ncbi:hypothetical protein GCM10011390_12700 [Aureimonas endophytica]|uniref:Uncharacterized protein n=1 Tax=Aureimonas endophytica TaxID=2027858 RepID=A0A916ZGU2_9HYPH|nr:TIGR02285 family protein [Aureimonas endophytica]GGD95420.1 hypothetical protein GCM10011390_12700 [Aureimonas endophytica]
MMFRDFASSVSALVGRHSSRAARLARVAGPSPSRRGLRLRAGAASLATLLVGAGLAPSASAEEAGVTWAIYDAAPFMIADGPNRDRGIFDQIRHLLDARLADIPHQTLSAPFPRIVTSLKAGAQWCFVGGVKTPEREDFAYFSLPVALFYPLRLVVPAEERQKFAAMAPLSLRHLLEERPDLRTSMLRNRSLGPVIDDLLRRFPPPETHSDFPEAFRMLLNRRLDYLIDYANIATYNADLLGRPGAFAMLPFEERPEPVFSRVMCARTPWGRAFIDRVDAVLREARPMADYRAIVEAWSAPEDLPTIRAAYDGAFLASE